MTIWIQKMAASALRVFMQYFLRNLPQKKNLNFFFLADLKVTFFVQAQGYFIGDLLVCLI